jgi:membrane AbrB-like protein
LELLRFFATMATAIACAAIFLKLRVPSAVMLGSMFGVALLNLTLQQAYYYMPIRIVIQAASGLIIGSRIRKEDIERILALKKPVAIVLTGFIIYNIVFGVMMYRHSSLDSATAMLAVAPGGTSDLTLIASDLGAKGSTVALVHVFRQIITFAIVPFLIRPYRSNKDSNIKNKKLPLRLNGLTLGSSAAAIGRLIIPFALSTVSGTLFKAAGLKSGMIVGAMAAAALYSCRFGEIHIPLYLRRTVFVFIGAYIGVQFTRDIFLSSRELAMPLFIGLAGTAVLLWALPRVLAKATNMPYPVCVLVSAPMGLTEMTVIADDLNRDYVAPVAIMHTLRLVMVVVAAPLLASLAEYCVVNSIM